MHIIPVAPSQGRRKCVQKRHYDIRYCLGVVLMNISLQEQTHKHACFGHIHYDLNDTNIYAVVAVISVHEEVPSCLSTQ